MTSAGGQMSVARCVRWQGRGAKAAWFWPPSDENAASVRASRRSSDVEEAEVLSIALDERAPLLDVLTHQHREHLVGLRGVLERDLQQQPVVRVERGVPQLVGVHLAEALVALDRVVLGQLLARLQAGRPQR